MHAMTCPPTAAGDGHLAVVHLPGHISDEALSRWQDLGCAADGLEPGHPAGERCWLCSPAPGPTAAEAGGGVLLTGEIARAERLGIIRQASPKITDAWFPPRPASGGRLSLVTPENLGISGTRDAYLEDQRIRSGLICDTEVVLAAIAEAGLRPGSMHDLLRYAEEGWNRADRVYAPGSLSMDPDDDLGYPFWMGKLHDDTLNLAWCDARFGWKQVLLVAEA